MNKIKITIATALAAAGIAGLAACGTSAASPVSGISTPISASASASPQAAAGLGTTYTMTSADIQGDVLATFKIQLNQVTEPAPQDPQAVTMMPLPAGQHLAGVQFTVTGLTGSMEDSAELDYSALGSDHQRYTPQIGYVMTGDTGGFSVQPGQVQTGFISFPVPNGVHITSVTYSPLVGSSPVTWSVSR